MAHAQFDAVLAFVPDKAGEVRCHPIPFSLCDISDLINGFHFPVFCDVRFLTKLNFFPLNFSSLNRNNRSISCNIMQNLGAFVGVFTFLMLIFSVLGST